MGFGGVGMTISDGYPSSEGEVVGEYGVGLRYLISKPLKMQGGFDVAWGQVKSPSFTFNLVRHGYYVHSCNCNDLYL